MLVIPDEKNGPAQARAEAGEVAIGPVSESPWTPGLWSATSGKPQLGLLNVPGKLKR